MPQIMTTKEVAEYLKLHEVTICKYAGEGAIPAIKIGGVWRFEKEALDKWIAGGQNNRGTGTVTGTEITKKKKSTGHIKLRKRKK
jgi:excisionase family DNA binding protein